MRIASGGMTTRVICTALTVWLPSRSRATAVMVVGPLSFSTRSGRKKVPLVPMPMSTSADWPLTVTVKPMKPLSVSPTRPATSEVGLVVCPLADGKSMNKLGGCVSTVTIVVTGSPRTPQAEMPVTKSWFIRFTLRIGAMTNRPSASTGPVTTPPGPETSTVAAAPAPAPAPPGNAPESTNSTEPISGSCASSTAAGTGCSPLSTGAESGGGGTNSSVEASLSAFDSFSAYRAHCGSGGSKKYVALRPSGASIALEGVIGALLGTELSSSAVRWLKNPPSGEAAVIASVKVTVTSARSEKNPCAGSGETDPITGAEPSVVGSMRPSPFRQMATSSTLMNPSPLRSARASNPACPGRRPRLALTTAPSAWSTTPLRSASPCRTLITKTAWPPGTPSPEGRNADEGFVISPSSRWPAKSPMDESSTTISRSSRTGALNRKTTRLVPSMGVGVMLTAPVSAPHATIPSGGTATGSLNSTATPPSPVLPTTQFPGAGVMEMIRGATESGPGLATKGSSSLPRAAAPRLGGAPGAELCAAQN